MSKNFDVVVIGGGPGGYIAAIRAWRNWACPPPASTSGRTTRAARARRHLHQRRLHPEQGAAAVQRTLRPCQPPLRRTWHRPSDLKRSTWKKMLARKDLVVKQNNDGILYLFKKNKVSFFHGRGSS